MMAGWQVGGAGMARSLSDSVVPPRPDYDELPVYGTKKRRYHQIQHLDIINDYRILQHGKRPRFGVGPNDYIVTQLGGREPAPAFFVIKEAGRPSSSQPRSSESYECGHSAHGVPAHRSGLGCDNLSAQMTAPYLPLRVRDETHSISVGSPLKMKDNDHHDAAARLVEIDVNDYRRRRELSRHERILRSLISPKALGTEFDIDDEALQGILSATNKMFFRGSLTGRVTWTWEDLPTNLIGTTAWRAAPNGHGYETLIFLSKQILKNKKYNRRLLISTFIHELIHSYLFINCGYQPDDCGGHTSGFKRIAQTINNWVGEENLLQLHKMEAELRDFEVKTTKNTLQRRHIPGGCQVQWLCDGTLGYIVLPPGPDIRYVEYLDVVRG
ncbi:hypothetical protein GGS20DRAFT_354601 [Poronia punctata]|nr:hypothetical protein GGS20DRAFT_354601 [Poronia punctata]